MMQSPIMILKKAKYLYLKAFFIQLLEFFFTSNGIEDMPENAVKEKPYK